MFSPRNISIFKNATLSILFFASAYFVASFKPVEKFIANQSELRERSLIYFFWETPPMPVLLKVYIFNVTNADEFQKGIDKKLKVQEIGPYVYREYLHHSNVKFHENGTVTYVPVRRTIPVPELSISDPHKDIITTVNIPLIGLSDVAADLSSIAALGMSTLAQSTHARPFINLTVHDYLWGYQDNLVALANNVLPNIFHFPKLGIMDRLFDEGQNIVTMHLPSAVKRMRSEAEDKRRLSKIQENVKTAALRQSEVTSSSTVHDVEYDDDYFTFENFNGIETMAQTLAEAVKPDDIEPIEELERRKHSLREYSIDSWNGSPGMKQWGFDSRNTESNSKCNTIRGAYDGTLFPKNIMIGEEFKLYRRAFCRTLKIRAEKQVKTYGIDTIQFALVDDAFDDSMNDTESECFCKKRGSCMRKGLGYAGSCYFTVPIAVSLPHFYKSDPRLFDDIEGMKPDREKHETVVMIQPTLGVPIRVQTRLQLNMVIGDTKFNSDLKNLDNQIYPLFWTELEMTTLTPGILVILMVVFFLLPALEILVIAIFIMKGFYHCIKAFLISLPCLKSASMKFPSATKKAKLYSQKSIKYSAVFPYIGREVIIFEDKEKNLITNAESV